MVGIYKITNQITNEVYIGKSKNIEERFEDYKTLNCRLQRKLFYSILNYGLLNHKFEVIEQCSIDELDFKESYWQVYYNSKNEGLNCVINRASLPKEEKKRSEYFINILSEKVVNIDNEVDLKIIQTNKGEKRKLIIKDPLSNEYNAKEKKQIILNAIGKIRTENKLNEFKSIILNWDYNTYGKITQKKIYENFNIGKRFVKENYSKIYK
jgi:hypothetical protein